MSTLHAKILSYIALGLGTAWQFRYLSSFATDDRRIALLLIALFDGILVVLVTFSARIKPDHDGVRVEQFGIKHLSFTELLNWVTVPFFPQTFVLVRTNRRFPLSVLFCPVRLDIDFCGKVETVKLVDFLRSHRERLTGRPHATDKKI